MSKKMLMFAAIVCGVVQVREGGVGKYWTSEALSRSAAVPNNSTLLQADMNEKNIAINEWSQLKVFKFSLHPANLQ